MIKYFLHLKDLVIKGNKVIEDGMNALISSGIVMNVG